MEAFTKLSRDVQIILGGTLLYVIFSFLNWQQVSAYGFTVGVTEWAGIGYLASLLAIVLFVWEVTRLYSIKIPVGDLSPGLISAALALLLVVFTVITFLTHGTARNWPAFVGLILAIVIGVVALKRAKAEGVEMPTLPSSTSGGGGTPSQ
jgi:hypothetical protein